jgi:two-component system, chemotaxis family, chemotaxis protein CheY
VKTLIVDDCAVSRELLAIAVDSYGTIDNAENGKEAILQVGQAIGQGAHYDLICLDITMPVIGGHETLQAIRALEADAGVPRATIFMITASSSPDDMIEAITAGGCDDYLTKPLMKKSFLDLLRKHALIPFS